MKFEKRGRAEVSLEQLKADNSAKNGNFWFLPIIIGRVLGMHVIR
jgi:hypothetical protein